MSDKALVTYATRYGATAGIAEKIHEVLNLAGVPSDLFNVKEVSDLSPYSAVVLGSAVYIGKWRKEATQFIKKNQSALAECPVWLFSSGPTEEGDPVELLEGWRIPESLKPVVDRIQVRDIAVFHGVMEPEKLNFFERWIVNNIKSPTGDFRDWEAISAWAASIAETLLNERAA